MIETFKAQYKVTPNQYGEPQSNASVNRMLELGSAIYTKVAEWTDYEFNPFRRVKHFKEKPRTRTLSPDEEQALFAAVDRPTRRMLRLAILLALHAGLRKGELAFRRAEIVVGVLGRVSDDQRLRVGKAYILDGHAHQAAGQRVSERGHAVEGGALGVGLALKSFVEERMKDIGINNGSVHPGSP